MKIFAALVFGFVVLHFASTPLYAQEEENVPVQGVVIVKYKDGQSPDDLTQSVERRETTRRLPIIGGVLHATQNLAYRIRREAPPEAKLSEVERARSDAEVTEEKKLYEQVDNDVFVYKTQEPSEKARDVYSSLSTVEYAALDYQAPPVPVVDPPVYRPNDPLYPRLWNLTKIEADRAWEIARGNKTILIGAVDTGVDYNHEDLPRDIINGYDFGYGDNDSMDQYPHGTQVAGIVNAVIDNNRGLAGIAPDVRLLAMNVYGYNPFYSMVAQAITYATDRGARVIYLEVQSYPGLSCTSLPYLQDAINYARARNVVIVSAAGNYDYDARYISPASCEGHIVVGASDRQDGREYYSNWGDVVDIAAPAQGITTIEPNNRYTDYFSGTSAATPHVAAAAALLLSINPNLTPDQVEEIIKQNGDPIYTDKFIGGKRLNVYKSVLAVLPQATSTPTPTTRPLPTNTPTPTSTPTPRPTNTPTPTLTPTIGVIRGDITGDGKVDVFDYNALVRHFGKRKPEGDTPADINKDGAVDVFDYNLLVAAFVGR